MNEATATLKDELERERIMHAACLTAAEGHAKGKNAMGPDNPYCSLAFQQVVLLRRAFEFLAGPGVSPQSVIDRYAPGTPTPSETNYAEAEKHDFYGR